MQYVDLIGNRSQDYLNEYVKHADSWYFEVEILEYEFCSGGVNNFKTLYLDDPSDRKILRVPIKEWLCTDTYVGMYEYYINLDGFWKFACISKQIGRKCSTNFEWLDVDMYNKTKMLWQEMVDNTNDDIVLLCLDDEVPDMFL